MKLSLTTAHALAAAIAGMTVGVSALLGALNVRASVPILNWLDVAVVYFVSALPLAASLAVAALPQLPLRRGNWVLLGLESAALLVVPLLYRQARCQHDLKQAEQFIEQYRFAEASTVVHRLIALHCTVKIQDTPLPELVRNIDENVQVMRQRVADPLPENVTDADRLRRAQHLAALGQTGEVMRVLESSASLSKMPDASLLRATIEENNGRWRPANEWYVQAKDGFQGLDESSERHSGLRQSLTGIAFTERKLGHLHAAETAWHELLALSPTADTHFLLAQFYHDTQQAAKAQYHARQATTLGPERYSAPASRLRNKLVTSHFGCWSVFSIDPHSPATPYHLREAKDLHP